MGQINVKRVSTDQQKADALTKALPVGKPVVMRHLLGVRDLGVVLDRFKGENVSVNLSVLTWNTHSGS